MRTRLLFWDEDEVRKKKTLVLVLAFLLIPLLLSLYAVTGPEGGLIAEVTPTTFPSPGAVATATPSLPIPTATTTPLAEATPTPVEPEPTVTPTSTALKPTLTPTITPIPPLSAPLITTPSDGSVLKDERPAIAGTAPPNVTVQVYDDGTLLGTTAAGAQGDWALVVDKPLESGEHTITAVAGDDTGRTSDPSPAVTFTVAIEHLPTTGSSWFERWLDKLWPVAFP